MVSSSLHTHTQVCQFQVCVQCRRQHETELEPSAPVVFITHGETPNSPSFCCSRAAHHGTKWASVPQPPVTSSTQMLGPCRSLWLGELGSPFLQLESVSFSASAGRFSGDSRSAAAGLSSSRSRSLTGALKHILFLS